MNINKSILGTAGEYYVAAELGKRNICAQLTMGNKKRTDIIIFSEESNAFMKIEVKCKQRKSWPACKGISKEDSMLIFVDFENIQSETRPVFYILSFNDWADVLEEKRNEYLQKDKNKEINIEKGLISFPKELLKNGKVYTGCTILNKNLEKYKEKWEKIINFFSK